MLENYESDRHIAERTDAEIYAAIRYLEPVPSRNEGNTSERNDDDGLVEDDGLVTSIWLCMALLACLVLAWLYWE
jgi:hypothetical protein